jgi:hypothetical protein
MNEESLRDIALDLLEQVDSLATYCIHEDEFNIDPDESLRKLKGEMAEYRRRIDSAK